MMGGVRSAQPRNHFSSAESTLEPALIQSIGTTSTSSEYAMKCPASCQGPAKCSFRGSWSRMEPFNKCFLYL